MPKHIDCSCPLPQAMTTSPVRAIWQASRIASPRSGTRNRSTPSRFPASCAAAALAPMISSRSSVRGSSAVSTTTSANSAAIRPIHGRFSRSRSPAQPKTTITRPSAICRAVRNAWASAFGVWAKSTMARKSCPSSMRSMRPGTPRTAATPSTMASGPRSSATAVAAAARTLLTL